MKFKIPDYMETQVHSAAVSTMCLSHDCQYLISGAEDGTVFMFQVKHRKYDTMLGEGKKSSQIANLLEERNKLTVALNDLYLEKATQIQEKNELIKKFNFEVVKAEQTIKIET